MNATSEAIINLNNADCIKEISNIGHTQYQNICTGALSTVPWGVSDWIELFVITFILSLVAGVVVASIFKKEL